MGLVDEKQEITRDIVEQSRGSLAGQASGERSEEHTSELQSRQYLVCGLLREKKELAGRGPAVEADHAGAEPPSGEVNDSRPLHLATCDQFALTPVEPTRAVGTPRFRFTCELQ